MAGRWPLEPAIEVRILAPERLHRWPSGKARVRKTRTAGSIPARCSLRSHRQSLCDCASASLRSRPRRVALLARWIGLGSSKPGGRVRFPGELVSVRGCDPSVRSSESLVRLQPETLCSRGPTVEGGAFSQRTYGFDSRREYFWKVRSAWCGHRSRKPGGAQAFGFNSYAFHFWRTHLAVARAPFAKRMDRLVAVAVRLRVLPQIEVHA
jgi:hypothetical protein